MGTREGSSFRSRAFVLAGAVLVSGCATSGAAGTTEADLGAWCDTMARLRDRGEPLRPADHEALLAVVPAEIREDSELVADQHARYGKAAEGTPRYEIALDHVFRYEAVHCRGTDDLPPVDHDAEVALLAAVTSPADRDDLGPALQTALDVAIRYLGVDGASVTVIGRDGGQWSAHSGVADAAGRPVTDRTRFALASITKTYTTVVAMRLAEDGVVALDAPVELDGLHPDTTLRHLLGHTSGLPNDAPFPTSVDRQGWTAEAFDAAADGAALCPPGECVAYSDLGFVAAGLVLERATGRPFPELLATEVLEPLGLRHTELVDGADQPERLAELDRRESPRHPDRPGWAVPHLTWTAGAMIATSAELAQFGDALAAGELLSPSSLAQIHDVDASAGLPCPTDNCPRPYGLGLDAVPRFGHTAWGHGGSSGAVLAHFPDQGLTIAVLTTRPGTGVPILGVITQVLPELALAQ